MDFHFMMFAPGQNCLMFPENVLIIKWWTNNWSQMHLVYGEKYICETWRRMTRLLDWLNSSYPCMRESVFAAISRSFEHISSLGWMWTTLLRTCTEWQMRFPEVHTLAFEEITIEKNYDSWLKCKSQKELKIKHIIHVLWKNEK